ncbi:DUF881 domain-containing protein [Antrihabitans spumae]|jgi:uncharacterized protein YlxW (UPF0749 family)|uniref:DUF881 domain-containing protein n=1 Tax=Antrihabitans spumae TaxID=3373370 RepID=A0ABW7JTD3_9NOCA
MSEQVEPGKHEFRDPPRPRRTQLVFSILAVLLVAALGVAIATKVRGTGSGDSLDSARPADLLVVLDTLNRREASLRQEIAELQRTVDAVQNSGSSAALEEARARLRALTIAVGTVGAVGPGLELRIDDPQGRVDADVLLATVQELRGAGAEALQLGDSAGVLIRVGIDTWVSGTPGNIVVDGRALSAPYNLIAIGDAPTLAAAVNIPGGVADTVSRNGGKLQVRQSDEVTVTALREPKPRQYSQPGN